MPFVKLDCGILDSTLWDDRDARDVFITALLMAVPTEILEPTPQIEVSSLAHTGWNIPPGWYGFVPAAGTGIVRRADVARKPGLAALTTLGSPEPDSRSQDFDGRRLVRVDGGYVVLNFLKYRERDYTAAERSKRWRDKKKAEAQHTVSGVAQHRNDTQAEAEAEAEGVTTTTTTLSGLPARRGRTNVAIEKYLGDVLKAVDADHQQRVSKKELRAIKVSLIFAYWQHQMGHMGALLSPEREARIGRHLEANGGNVHELLYVVDGWFKDPTFREMAENGRTLDQIKNLFTDRDRIERLAGHCKGYRDGKPHKMAVKYLAGLDAAA